MTQFDRLTLGRQAKELGFVRDTFEKVCRLVDVLSFMEKDPALSDTLALKGGTAINLAFFDLLRLSVDIDLDFAKDVSREEMLEDRERITDHIQKYMAAAGYSLSPRSKQYHALDSFVYEYVNAGGMRDNLKIEINYMLRCHVLPLSRRNVELPWNEEVLTVLCVDPLEIFAAKAVALMNRAAARDLYDMFNLQQNGHMDLGSRSLFRQAVLFYMAISSENVPEHISFEAIDEITEHKIRTDLTPVLRRASHFQLVDAKEKVKAYLTDLLLPEGDLSFWKAFAGGKYKPELLFDDPDVLERVRNHPMALWKCGKNDGKI